MRRSSARISSLAFTALAAITLGVAPVRAAINADFNAGASTYPDAPGAGWVTAWQESAGVTPSVVNASPLDGGTSYLAVDGTGAIRNVVREYESFGAVDVSQPHAISWSYRLDAPNLNQFTSFNDRVNFFARGDISTGSATSAADSWEILATGAPHGSGAVGTPAQFHVFDRNDGTNGFNPTNIVDTGLPLNPGDIYDFHVTVDPAQQAYAVRLSNRTTGHTAVGNQLNFRNTTDPFTALHLGGRTSAGSDNMPYSLDSVNIAASTGLDGVISYGGTPGPNGVSELVDMVVRRGGVDHVYTASDLIGVTLTHFKGGASATNILVPAGAGGPATGQRATLLEDLRFDTGVINPAVAATPLTSDPVIDANDPSNSTPGFAVMFDIPVTNTTGPDVVVFDIQTTSNPVGGDAFHVSPLHGLDDGLNSATVFAYDIQFGDLAALDVADFNLFQYTGGSPMSLADLENDNIAITGGTRSGFQLLAAGIDLSDLGYPDGASVSGLFFQAADPGSVFDPVLIVGLPVPEPGTAALLGLGSLALLRRRRRG